MERSITATIRLISIAGRASIIFIAALLLSPEEYANYVLIAAASALTTIFIGLDYTRLCQPIIFMEDKQGEKKTLNRLFNFTHISSLTFFVLTLIFSLFTPTGRFDTYSIVIFIFLTLSDYYAQEATRVLVILNKQRQSANTLVIRSVTPPLILLPIALLPHEIATTNLSFTTILSISICCNSIAAIYGWKVLFGSNKPEIRTQTLPRFSANDANNILFFFLATCISKAITTLDKYYIELGYGSQQLATYALTASAALLIVPIIDITIGSYAGARFLSVIENTNQLRKRVLNAQSQSLMLALLFTTIAPLVFSHLSIRLFPSYNIRHDIHTYLIFLCFSLYACSTIPNIFFVCTKKPRALFFSTLGPLLPFSIWLLFSTPSYTNFLVGASLTMTLSLILKLLFCLALNFRK